MKTRISLCAPVFARVQARYLPSKVMLAIEIPLILGAFARGYDFTHRPEAQFGVLPPHSPWMPSEHWGWVFLVGAFVLGLGVATWRHFAVWSGHAFLAVVHMGLVIAAVQATAPHGEWRIPATLLLPTVVHFLFAWYLGPVARRTSSAVPQ